MSASIFLKHMREWHKIYIRFRSLTLSIAGSIAGVLGLQNLDGFLFFFLSVMFVNLVLVFINAHGNPEEYFSLYPAPLLTTSLEKLVPSTAEKLRQPVPPLMRAMRITQWVIFQGLQENILAFILWWTFWHGIVHGKSIFVTWQCMTEMCHYRRTKWVAIPSHRHTPLIMVV